MKLWLITQDVNRGYDTYDSAVVAAEDRDAARLIDPSNRGWDRPWNSYDSWCQSPQQVAVEYLGEAKNGTKEGIILASFNAG